MCACDRPSGRCRNGAELAGCHDRLFAWRGAPRPTLSIADDCSRGPGHGDGARAGGGLRPFSPPRASRRNAHASTCCMCVSPVPSRTGPDVHVRQADACAWGYLQGKDPFAHALAASQRMCTTYGDDVAPNPLTCSSLTHVHFTQRLPTRPPGLERMHMHQVDACEGASPSEGPSRPCTCVELTHVQGAGREGTRTGADGAGGRPLPRGPRPLSPTSRSRRATPSSRRRSSRRSPRRWPRARGA